MMKILRWTGIAIGVFVGIVVLFAGWVAGTTYRRLHRKLDVPAAAPTVGGFAARGKYLVTVRNGCVECHGSDLAGDLMVDDPALGEMHGSNVTPATLKDWTDGEIARAIRHGVGRDGRPLILMPSQDYQHLSEADVADMVAYLRAVPAVDRPSKPCRLGPVMMTRYALGKEPALTPADVVDPLAPYPPAVKDSVTPEFGRYLARTACMGCHGRTFAGGPVPAGDPAWPPASPLTPDALRGWTEEQFVNTLRTGVNPSGARLRYPMIVKYTAQYSDTELRALWAFIQTLSLSKDLSEK